MKYVKPILAAVVRHVDIRDAHVYGGILLIAIGAASVSFAAACVVTGLMLIWLARVRS